MRLNSRARCAVHLAVEIARNDGNGATSLGQVSIKTKISRRYLDKLAACLKHAKLLEGLAGRSGGYRLTRAADAITLTQIIEAANGEMNIVECVEHPDVCEKADNCPCRTIYRVINHRIVATLDGISLADLAASNEPLYDDLPRCSAS